MAGAPLAEDVSVPALARRVGELAEEHGCDVVVGFSHGATVALEALLSGHFRGPVVLLGISLTTEDEARFEKGDRGLTDAERATLTAAAHVTLVTIPGAVFLLPDEVPQQTAAVIATVLSQAT
jgi:hypothetical protein